MLTVLNEFGITIPNLTKEDFLRDNPMSGVHFGREPLRIDILNKIDGVAFDECYPNKQTTVIENTPVYYIHFNDLKKNKLHSGRTKDKADIEELEEKRKKKKKNL